MTSFKDSTKILTLINGFSQVVGHQINAKSCVFLHTISKPAENQRKYSINYNIKEVKYLRTNLIKEVREICILKAAKHWQKELIATDKCKYNSYMLSKEYAKMFALPQVIYRFNYSVLKFQYHFHRNFLNPKIHMKAEKAQYT